MEYPVFFPLVFCCLILILFNCEKVAEIFGKIFLYLIINKLTVVYIVCYLFICDSICSSLHGCTLLTSEVAIYFILVSLCYLFHTNYLSLHVLFYRKGIDAHAACTCCAQILKSCMHGHFCSGQITGLEILSSV